MAIVVPMLVVISDLHLVDGTAGDHNIKGGAFELWMDEILHLVECQRATELVFLYLGDIVDLLRTEQWFDVPLADRPWGSPALLDQPHAITARCRAQAGKILGDIAAAAKGALDILSGRDPAIRARLDRLGVDVRRIFVPGNHDRLYVVDPTLQAAIDALLGVDPRGLEGLELHRLESRRYGLLARHGHEFDVWNFEGWAPGRFDFDAADYAKPPIGDPITTELVARLPWAVRRRLEEQGLDEAVVEGVTTRLQDIENVRPVAAAIPWIYYEAGQIKRRGPWPQRVRDAVVAAVERTATELFDAFMELPFVTAWLRKHDRWGDPLDEADKLLALHRMFRRGIRLDTVRYFLTALEGLGLTAEGAQRRAALVEPLLQDPKSDVHYVVYGHTHQFEQVALRTVDEHEKIYFNSGTWRPRYTRAGDGQNFVQWKEMTYLVFYNEDEDPLGDDRKGVSFETWTGTMLKRAR